MGILQILLSGFCFGFLGLFGKWAFALGLPSGEFLALRFLVASLVLGAWLVLRSRVGELRLSSRHRFAALALGAFGYAVFASFFFFALSGLPASLTVLLLYTFPVWVALGGWLFLGERLSPAQWVALPLVLVGLALVVGAALDVNVSLYLAVGLLSAFCYAAYILASRRFLEGASPLGSTFYVLLGAALVLAPLHLRNLPADLSAWGVVLGTAVVGTVLAVGLFLAGLQKVLSAEASILSLAEPCTGVALAAIFLHEALAPSQWLGGGLILSGMALVVLARGDRT